MQRLAVAMSLMALAVTAVLTGCGIRVSDQVYVEANCTDLADASDVSLIVQHLGEGASEVGVNLVSQTSAHEWEAEHTVMEPDFIGVFPEDIYPAFVRLERTSSKADDGIRLWTLAWAAYAERRSNVEISVAVCREDRIVFAPK